MRVEVLRKTFKVGGIVAAACVVALCGTARARAAEPPTAKELYRQALTVMNDLKEPPFVTFRLDGIGDGLRVDMLTEDCDGREAVFRDFEFGNNRVRWTLRHRTQDGATEIVDTADGHRYVSTFDPTWLSTYQALRSPPLHFGPWRAWLCSSLRARNEPTPAPSDPAASPGPVLTVIGTVVALGPGIYNVEDRGAAPCPNGDPGHALHLWSRTNDPRQTLSDVVIDLRSMRFCTIRFGVRSGGSYGVSERHFADVGGYWLQTDGSLELTARVAGIAAGHGVWRYRLSEFQFPDSLPPDVFTPPLAFDPAPYLHAQRVVDIGGRRLNLYCTGSGSPTVILDANEGDDTSDWRFVQPLVAKHTQVCSYDRAGFGFSDPGPLPRDAAATVHDLRALLAKAPLARPFVLASYSSSTLSARLYADRHLDDLAGLVLVEPDIEDREKALFAAAPALEPLFAQGWAAAKACTSATERGGLKPDSDLYRVCTSTDPQLPASLKAVIGKRQLRPEWWTAYNSDQLSDRTISPAELRSEQRQYGNLPLAVLVVADPFMDAPLPPDQRRAERKFMSDFTAPLARFSSSGSRVEIEGCSHGDVLTHCASSVAAAIDKVVAQARHVP